MAAKNPPLDGYSSGPDLNRQYPLIGNPSWPNDPTHTASLSALYGCDWLVFVLIPAMVHFTTQETNRQQKHLIKKDT